jgi:hypothetical protein
MPEEHRVYRNEATKKRFASYKPVRSYKREESFEDVVLHVLNEIEPKDDDDPPWECPR